MNLSTRRPVTIIVAACLLGAGVAASIGQILRVVVGWAVLVEPGDERIFGPHPATVFAAWAFLVVGMLVIVRAVAKAWGPAARARVSAGAWMGLVAGLVAGVVLWWLAQPLGYQTGGWTKSELSYYVETAIGPLAPGLGPVAQLVGLRGIALIGPAVAWAVYGAVAGLAWHAWALRRSRPNVLAA